MRINAGRLVFSGVFAALSIALAGTASAASAATAQSPYDFADPQTLIKKAHALGESELAKMSAAEMIYRDLVRIHLLRADLSSGVASESCMKLYRQFTGFEVLDIERSQSILKPIKITIRFDFNRVGTQKRMGVRFQEKMIQDIEHDVAFIVHDTDSITREYFCTPQGDPVELPSPVLERPILYFKGGRDPGGEYWLEDPRKPTREY